jgi:hypothetical protein
MPAFQPRRRAGLRHETIILNTTQHVKMRWPYEFVDLTDAQKHHRRVLLDAYGLVAQASAGVVLLLIQLYFLAQWLRQRRNGSDGIDVPSSPSLKNSQKGGRLNPRVAAQYWRRLEWWCGDSVRILGVDLGTKGQITVATTWTTWLLYLSFAETGNGESFGRSRIILSHQLTQSQTISTSRNDSALLQPHNYRSTIS